ncbi:alpha-ketoacid dehydrogenase subunit beta [Ralstonia solanacearum]|uniref:alpha-ketoacid dehydrogenase subunit beta n=1 Tax=Ralstonia solanacearum TaxID=305 RepID=UPI002029FC0B|nr:alpha-ketoacid dehydrogenase subunit beta [Ralstonia solanacearum]MCL9845050.1 alpha-ketoacid dehydrogenase subunit beta [Ralstonia solanacearum]MDC6253434.1 alpha-ketoacid dehydrogenase subunit beta [Ralstonia solanacearum]MDC6258012.1 alpha-ketoacid dehydrogenase subunit beta [Ralstonia solanacearum]MDC6302589.1 alpha-ketoacid dehydrogenase subunit beta [Ralstonia solanacearum]
MADVNLVEAVNLALAHALEHDPSVVLLGEDIGVNGGVFRATVGLQARFGAERVIDTPLAETALAGAAVGMAAMGLRPVVEIQFSGFIYPAIDHVLNHAARLRHRTRGRLSCPMVIRSPCGAGIHAPEHHSESPEALFAHMPGLRVVMPSSPVEDNGEALPLDTCFTLRDGTDVTLVSWGGALQAVLAAADRLAQDGVLAEVIDVATLKPLDMETILASVAKTGRCVIVHEAPRTSGFGAEIAANLAEHGLYSLLAPVQRVTGYDVVMPLPRLENQYLPGVERILAAVGKTLEAA